MSTINNQNQDQDQEKLDQEQNQEQEQTPGTDESNTTEQKQEEKGWIKKLRADSVELRKLKKENEEREQAKLEEQGQFKELLEQSKARIAELESELSNKERGQLVDAALKKAGASDEIIDLLSDKILKDHDWDGGDDVQSLVEEIKANKPTLFNTQTKGAQGLGKSSNSGNSDIDALKKSNSDDDLKRLIELSKK